METYGICGPGFVNSKGFHCADGDYSCTPGELLPMSRTNTCNMRCLTDGQSTEIADPLVCRPDITDYIDNLCRPSPRSAGVAVFETNTATGQYGKLVENCGTSMCIRGMCAASKNTSCTEEGKLAMREDGSCLLRCQNGNWKDTGGCGRIHVNGYNNRGGNKILQTLAVLPDHLFENISLNIRNVYVDQTEITSDAEGNKLSTLGNATGNINILSDLFANQTFADEMIIHEFFHTWGLQNGSQLPPILDKSIMLTSINNFILSHRGTSTPEYVQVTHCDDPAKQLLAVREYGNTNCSEDFADHAAFYVTDPCQLLKVSPERYAYFRDKVFNGKEYRKKDKYECIGDGL